MKKIPRRAQPSWISHLGRTIIGRGPGATVLAGAGLLLLFVGLTLPVVLAVTPKAEAKSDGAALSVKFLRGRPAGESVSFPEKQGAVDRSVADLMVEIHAEAAGGTNEIAARRSVEGRDFDFKYREVAVPPAADYRAILGRFQDTLAAPRLGIDLVKTEFDSKTTRLTVVIDTIPTHAIVFTRGSEEDDSTQETVAEAPTAPPARLVNGRPRVAVIIDDIGFRPQFDQAFLEIDAPLTFSVLPFTPDGARFAERAHALGREVMLHMPMEPIDYPNKNPGRGALMTTDSAADVARGLAAAIDDVPFAEGVNNHMGSRFTQDRRLVRAMLAAVRDRGLFFVDSLTYGSSVAHAVAREMGVPCAVRNVFLDHDPQFRPILEKIGQLVSIAQKNGFAVGIGHPHVATLEVLKTYLPGLKGRGIDVVPVSELVY